jgi:hypothetical protein
MDRRFPAAIATHPTQEGFFSKKLAVQQPSTQTQNRIGQQVWFNEHQKKLTWTAFRNNLPRAIKEHPRFFRSVTKKIAFFLGF